MQPLKTASGMCLRLFPLSFFTKLSSIFFTIGCLNGFSVALSQDLTDCQRDYSGLQEKARTVWDRVRPEMNLYVSHEFLLNLERGRYEDQRSPLVYFEYLRPASRHEIRQGSVQEFRREAVGVDGNIYVARECEIEQVLFRSNEAFEGDYFYLAGDSTQVLPLGLEPMDVFSIKDVPVTVVERTAQYVLLEMNGEELVCYPGDISPALIWDTERVRQTLNDKEAMAKALIGQEYLIQSQSDLRFRSSPNGNDHVMNVSDEGVSIRITNTIADYEKVLLITRDHSPNFFVIDEASDFLMYDAGCVAETKAVYRQQLQAEAESEGTNDRLTEMIRFPNPAQDWRTDEWATKVIENRFFLEEDPHSGAQRYSHISGDDHQLSLRTFLSAGLNEKGQNWLISNFASQEGLYHTRIIVFFDEDSLFSTRVPALDRRNERQYHKDWIIERLTLNEEDDREILKRIALGEADKIRIRFTSGGSFFEDRELEEQDRLMIRDIWMMSEIIKEKNSMSLLDKE